jgi:hypothetical protein
MIAVVRAEGNSDGRLDQWSLAAVNVLEMRAVLERSSGRWRRGRSVAGGG